MVSSAIVGDKQFDERIQLQAVRILSQILSSENCRETSWKREDQSNKSSAMLREVLFYYASTTLQKSKPVFYDIAKLYDGQDRFYLAALNIACGTDPARRDAILVDFDKHFPEWNDKVAELVFELRPKCMMLKLPGLLSDGKLTPMQKARIVDILAASPEADAGKTMLTLLAADHQPEVKAKALANLRLFLPTKWKDLVKSQELGVTIDEFLNGPYQRPLGFELAAVAQDMSRVPVIAGYANRKDRLATERAAAIQALGQLRCEASMKVLADVMGARGDPLAPQAATALGLLITNTKPDAISQTSLESLQRKLQKNDNEPPELVNAILASLASSKLGTQWLLQQQEAKKLRPELAAEAGKLLRNSPFQGERNKALILFPAVAKLDLKTLPPPAELAKRTGDAKAGREVYLASFKGEAQCMKCHTVHKEGGAIGPDLSAIGKKASRENLFESILQPSKAVADQFVTWKIDSDDGSSATGLIVKETPTEIVLRDANGKDYTFAAKSMVKKKTPTSLMAEDVVKALTEQELIDLVEYLYSLKE